MVPDHTTGPRLIILLTDLQGNRLENGGEIKAEKDQVFYLTNDFSKGFVNSVNKAAYLVLGLKQGVLVEQAEHGCDDNQLLQMFSKGDLVVCKSSKTQAVKFETAVLVFNTKTDQLSQYAADATIPLSEHDLLIKRHGNYQ